MSIQFPILATGRRKSAIAQVKIIKGTGVVMINEKLDTIYLQENLSYSSLIKKPFQLLKEEKNFDANQFDIFVKVSGGGLAGQTDAIKLGIARACSLLNESYRTCLKKEGFLTRDSRAKERKKYGLKKARKAPQYSKR